MFSGSTIWLSRGNQSHGLKCSCNIFHWNVSHACKTVRTKEIDKSDRTLFCFFNLMLIVAHCQYMPADVSPTTQRLNYKYQSQLESQLLWAIAKTDNAPMYLWLNWMDASPISWWGGSSTRWLKPVCCHYTSGGSGTSNYHHRNWSLREASRSSEWPIIYLPGSSIGGL